MKLRKFITGSLISLGSAGLITIGIVLIVMAPATFCLTGLAGFACIAGGLALSGIGINHLSSAFAASDKSKGDSISVSDNKKSGSHSVASPLSELRNVHVNRSNTISQKWSSFATAPQKYSFLAYVGRFFCCSSPEKDINGHHHPHNTGLFPPDPSPSEEDASYDKTSVPG